MKKLILSIAFVTTIITLLLCSCKKDDDLQPEPAKSTYTPQKRTYYIAAEELKWDYAPEGMNMMSHTSFSDDENVFVGNSDSTIGSVYKKAIYREYTDATFTTLKIVLNTEHLGILGPIIRGVVGDSIEVVLKNATSIPVSIHPHGVYYDKSNEGVNNMVSPGDTYTYHWYVSKSSAPGPSDPSSICFPYHSHYDAPKDINTGLAGMIVIVKPEYADENAFPIDVDKEFFNLFIVSDENESHYFDENVLTYPTNPSSVDVENDAFIESNLMHGINGYVYGNMPMMSMKKGDNVRWYLMALGTEVDLHTAHWHGGTVLQSGNRVDVIDLLPAITRTVDMKAENPGVWMYHCHVHDHIKAGMMTMYEILD